MTEMKNYVKDSHASLSKRIDGVKILIEKLKINADITVSKIETSISETKALINERYQVPKTISSEELKDMIEGLDKNLKDMGADLKESFKDMLMEVDIPTMVNSSTRESQEVLEKAPCEICDELGHIGKDCSQRSKDV